MNKSVLFVLVVCSCLPLSGCSRAFIFNRTRDLLDCITIAGGVGAGAKVMIGPVNTGLVSCADVIGFRDGVFDCMFTDIPGYSHNNFIFPLGTPLDLRKARHAIYGLDIFRTRTAGDAYYINKKPIIAELVVFDDEECHANQFKSQIEIAGGLLLTVRLGVNPGEMVDFVRGFWGSDIYHDDLYPYWSLSDKNKQREMDKNIDKPCESGSAKESRPPISKHRA